MRYVGSFFIIFACLGMGISYATQKRKRMETLIGMCAALELMKGEIQTKLSSLPELSLTIARRSGAPAAEFFTQLYRSLENLGEDGFADIWKRTAEKTLCSLDAGELEEINSLGNIIGRCELDMQTEAIAYCLSFLKNELQNARLQYPSERKLGIGLGAASAALLLISLI